MRGITCSTSTFKKLEIHNDKTNYCAVQVFAAKQQGSLYRFFFSKTKRTSTSKGVSETCFMEELQMYQDFFPNDPDNEWDQQLFFRFTAYLRQTIRVKRAKYLKKAHQEQSITENLNIDISDLENDNQGELSIEAIEFKQALQAELSKLKPRESEAFMYWFTYGMEDKEIAQRMGISRSGAQYLRSQALKKLAKFVGEWLQD